MDRECTIALDFMKGLMSRSTPTATRIANSALFFRGVYMDPNNKMPAHINAMSIYDMMVSKTKE